MISRARSAASAISEACASGSARARNASMPSSPEPRALALWMTAMTSSSGSLVSTGLMSATSSGPFVDDLSTDNGHVDQGPRDLRLIHGQDVARQDDDVSELARCERSLELLLEGAVCGIDRIGLERLHAA